MDNIPRVIILCAFHIEMLLHLYVRNFVLYYVSTQFINEMPRTPLIEKYGQCMP